MSAFGDALVEIVSNRHGTLRLPTMQSFIAGTLTVIVSALWVQGLDVPEGLLNVYLIVIGFFFGDRIGEQRANRDHRTVVLEDPVSG